MINKAGDFIPDSERWLQVPEIKAKIARGYPLIAIAGTVLVAAVLYGRWVRAGRPRGIDAIERQAEADA